MTASGKIRSWFEFARIASKGMDVVPAMLELVGDLLENSSRENQPQSSGRVLSDAESDFMGRACRVFGSRDRIRARDPELVAVNLKNAADAEFHEHSVSSLFLLLNPISSLRSAI